MAKRLHEVRDPIHVFVHFDDDERAVIDSEAFQRLRNVHQLALTYLVYPGASHKRFEHSLGVMELAGRIYDVVTREDKLSDAVRDVVPSQTGSERAYWRTVVRMAALCHDLGHLPFSHAAEKELLPRGTDHESITWAIVHSDEMRAVFERLIPPIVPDLVGKLALGPKKAAKLGLRISFDSWEAILAEMIVGDAFGADRMDYLLRVLCTRVSHTDGSITTV
jgi:HD superfamily phosphohydrolase